MRRRKRRWGFSVEVRMPWTLLGTKLRPLSHGSWRRKYDSRSRLYKVRGSSARLLAALDTLEAVQAGKSPKEIITCLF